MDRIHEMALEILEVACESDEVREDDEMDLFDAGLMDSITMVAVIIEMENKTGISLKPTEIRKENVKTVACFEQFLREKVK